MPGTCWLRTGGRERHSAAAGPVGRTLLPWPRPRSIPASPKRWLSSAPVPRLTSSVESIQWDASTTFWGLLGTSQDVPEPSSSTKSLSPECTLMAPFCVKKLRGAGF